ncbi:MAG TPA: CBS domain-containing protein [Actinophytocola sp.]|uniref:CBS domain-containing protein n=1 Tax=Actinophytocola sp. TaxID=1872138 RepID=UPI002DBA1F09|nr:CBS domain-containing protein [Actinophytocola sp.]HEU5469297.1 CBS domain-containing protein [Actinophytocola sp.]
MRTPTAGTVRVLMTDRVVAVTAATTLEDALRVMTECRVRHLPVMEGDRCVGMVQESDLLWTLWTHGAVAEPVGRNRIKPAPLVDPDDPMVLAAARMSEGGNDAALVTRDGSIVGIITAADIVRYVGEHGVEQGG